MSWWLSPERDLEHCWARLMEYVPEEQHEEASKEVQRIHRFYANWMETNAPQLSSPHMWIHPVTQINDSIGSSRCLH